MGGGGEAAAEFIAAAAVFWLECLAGLREREFNDDCGVAVVAIVMVFV